MKLSFRFQYRSGEPELYFKYRVLRTLADTPRVKLHDVYRADLETIGGKLHKFSDPFGGLEHCAALRTLDAVLLDLLQSNKGEAQLDNYDNTFIVGVRV